MGGFEKLMKIREYENSDEQDVIGLWSVCGLTVPWNDAAKDISRKLQERRELFLIGELEESIVASAMGGYEGYRGWANYLAVSPLNRNQGFGVKIMNEIEACLLALGCPKINLMIRGPNEQVIKFYRSLGYTPDAAICMGERLISDQ